MWIFLLTLFVVAAQDVDTAIIFDLDDTLFPSSVVYKKGINLSEISLSADELLSYNRLDATIVQTFEALQPYGNLYGVTAGLENWVDYVFKHLPMTKTYIENYFVDRKFHLAREEKQKYKSKFLTFKRILTSKHVPVGDEEDCPFCVDCKYKHVISIGDSIDEISSLHNLNYHVRNNFTKHIVKLGNRSPTIETLISQLNQIIEGISSVLLKDHTYIEIL